MTKNMKIKRGYILIIAILILSACDGIDWEKLKNPCIDCYNIKPVEGILEIKMTYNEEDIGIPLVIYKGDFEDNQVEWVDTSYEAKYDIWVPVNQYYSVRVEYLNGNDTIYVFDGDAVRIIKESTECDEVCWRPRDGKVDVRLKY